MKNYAPRKSPQPAAVSHLGAFARDTMDTVQKVVDDGKTAAKVQYEATSRWIGDTTRENPVRALSIVAAAGLVIGLLLGRR